MNWFKNAPWMVRSILQYALFLVPIVINLIWIGFTIPRQQTSDLPNEVNFWTFQLRWNFPYTAYMYATVLMIFYLPLRHDFAIQTSPTLYCFKGLIILPKMFVWIQMAIQLLVNFALFFIWSAVAQSPDGAAHQTTVGQSRYAFLVPSALNILILGMPFALHLRYKQRQVKQQQIPTLLALFAQSSMNQAEEGKSHPLLQETHAPSSHTPSAPMQRLMTAEGKAWLLILWFTVFSAFWFGLESFSVFFGSEVTSAALSSGGGTGTLTFELSISYLVMCRIVQLAMSPIGSRLGQYGGIDLNVFVAFSDKFLASLFYRALFTSIKSYSSVVLIALIAAMMDLIYLFRSSRFYFFKVQPKLSKSATEFSVPSALKSLDGYNIPKAYSSSEDLAEEELNDTKDDYVQLKSSASPLTAPCTPCNMDRKETVEEAYIRHICRVGRAFSLKITIDMYAMASFIAGALALKWSSNADLFPTWTTLETSDNLWHLIVDMAILASVEWCSGGLHLYWMRRRLLECLSRIPADSPLQPTHPYILQSPHLRIDFNVLMNSKWTWIYLLAMATHYISDTWISLPVVVFSQS